MRTTLLVVAVAAAALASPAGAGSGSDRVGGSGKFATAGAIPSAMAFNVSVHDITTTGATGHVNYRGVTNLDTLEEDSGHADVVCADVRGNRAVVIAKFKEGDRPFGEGFDFVQLYLEDNGSGNRGEPDRALATGADSRSQGGVPACPFAGFEVIAAAAMPIEHGNVRVREGA
jgi:hypothetical protein